MDSPDASCQAGDHGPSGREAVNAAACQRAADMFSALGDPNRLRLLTLLMAGEMCVTEIADALGDSLSAVSQRLKLLRSERIVNFRRQGKHVVYSLDDQHVLDLISNALAHADHA